MRELAVINFNSNIINFYNIEQLRHLPNRQINLPPVSTNGTPKTLPPILKPGIGVSPSRPPRPGKPSQPARPPSYGDGSNLPPYHETNQQGTGQVPPSYPEDHTSARQPHSLQRHQQPQQEQRRIGLDSQELSDNPIHVAAMNGAGISQLKSLAMQFGVEHRDSGGRTPLMYAVIGNQPKMCELLLKLKASVNARDMTGLTPLLWATYKAHADVIKVLLKYVDQ